MENKAPEQFKSRKSLKTKSDKNLILITSFFLFLEVTWLLIHLQIIPNPFRSKEGQITQISAGYVLKSQRELRKRNMNSLVWENASIDDTLYYFDSVLTLSQSTATLYLKEQTEVHMSENTLVTIEPQDSSSNNQIRLKFSRGDLRARNPFASTRIETDQWSLNLDQGSEVSLRQTGKEDFEVEVLKGNLEFEKDANKQAIAKNRVLKIEKNQMVGTLSIGEDLKFQGPGYQRFYSHKSEAKIPITWKGTAEKIQIIPLGKDSLVKAIEPKQTADLLELIPGKYTLRLVNNDQVSEAKEIEIWQTPNLQLITPFPRDRVYTNQSINFVWSYIPEAKEYKIYLTDHRTGKTVEQTVKDNYWQYTFSNEGDIEWKVVGLDSDGFEMPSNYSNELFPRFEPFAAPKLKSPELRVPASKEKSNSDEKPKSEKNSKKKKKTSFFQMIFESLVPSAQAEEAKQEELPWVPNPVKEANAPSSAKPAPNEKKNKKSNYEALFAWEKVDGADLYTIEISDSLDFHSPQTTKVIKKTEFIWKNFPLGKYYWRVAAGSSKGRMGVFSEPAKVDLSSLPDKSSQSDGVLIRKTLDPDAERPNVEIKTEEIVANAPKPSFDESRFEKETKMASDQERNLRERYLLEYSPAWTSWNLSGEDQLKAKMNGSSLGAFHFQTEQTMSFEKSYFVDVFYAQYKWKAADTTTYPFQEDQLYADFRTQILFGNNKSGVLRGAIVQTVPSIERKDLEKIEVKTNFTLGPSALFSWNHSERYTSDHSFSVLAGSQIFVFTNQNRLRYQVYKGIQSAATLGVFANEDFVFIQRSFSWGWTAGISIGYEN